MGLVSAGIPHHSHLHTCTHAFLCVDPVAASDAAASAPLLPPTEQGLPKDARFACTERAALLSALYLAVEQAGARGNSLLAPTLLG